MRIDSFNDLEKLGWQRRPNNNGRNSYLRPNKRVVNKRRDLTTNEQRMFGDILFPGHRGQFVSEPPRTMTQSSLAPSSTPSPALSSQPSPVPYSPPTTSTNTQGRTGDQQSDREIRHELELNEVEVI